MAQAILANCVRSTEMPWPSTPGMPKLDCLQEAGRSWSRSNGTIRRRPSGATGQRRIAAVHRPAGPR